jgi:hypothetical protein
MAALSFVALLALIAVAGWLLGSIVLRIAGALLALAGLLALGTAPAVAIGVFIAGAVAWLAGHRLYALRHHTYRSPLARRVFLKVLPRRLDPTRGWAIPVVIDGQQSATPHRKNE